MCNALSRAYHWLMIQWQIIECCHQISVRRNTRPHRTAPDPKILRDGIDQTPWLIQRPNANFWGPVQSFLEVWGSGAVGWKLYILLLGCTGRSGQSYGSGPISGRTPGLPIVWKGRGDLSPNFWGSGAVVFMGLGSSAIGLKLCISRLGCTGGQGRVVGPYPLWVSVSG